MNISLANSRCQKVKKGGEFFTPITIVKLIVEVIEPYHGRIYDPACGSGGMFVQSAAFVQKHRKSVDEIAIYGQEKVDETIRLCKMNLAVHGIAGDIRAGEHLLRRHSSQRRQIRFRDGESTFQRGQGR